MNLALYMSMPRTLCELELKESEPQTVIIFNNNKMISAQTAYESTTFYFAKNIKKKLEEREYSVDKIEELHIEFVNGTHSRIILYSPTDFIQMAINLRALPLMLREKQPVGGVFIDSINTFSHFAHLMNSTRENVSFPTGQKKGRTSGDLDMIAELFQPTERLCPNTKINQEKHFKMKSLDESVMVVIREILTEIQKEYNCVIIETRINMASNEKLFKGRESKGIPHVREINNLLPKGLSPRRTSEVFTTTYTQYHLLFTTLAKMTTSDILCIPTVRSQLFEQLLKINNYMGEMGYFSGECRGYVRKIGHLEEESKEGREIIEALSGREPLETSSHDQTCNLCSFQLLVIQRVQSSYLRFRTLFARNFTPKFT